MAETSDELRRRILELVARYHDATWGAPPPFVPGQSPVPVAGKVFDADELSRLVDASLDFRLTTDRFATQFEEDLGRLFGLQPATLVNSGSSANLLALAALTSPALGERRLRPGDEVITVAAGFPTTVNPILQNQLVPVFLDVTTPGYNVDVTQFDAALSPRTRAIMLAHTLGNPFDLDAVTRLARAHNLWLIEDCCDAVGTTWRGRPAGSFGDLATVSFYPAHHLTTGEGGAVLTASPELKRLVESFRDWGRDCWCGPGHDDTCHRRFNWQFGSLPFGYDHKYIFSHVGYNLKMTDLQAAVGCAQIRKLPAFTEARKRNFDRLRDGLAELADRLILPEPTPGGEPCWFGFPISVRPDAPFSRLELTNHLESRRIATRLMFAGNLTRQPAYLNATWRKVGELPVTDFVMNQSFWIGVYPGLTPAMLDFVVETIVSFCRSQ